MLDINRWANNDLGGPKNTSHLAAIRLCESWLFLLDCIQLAGEYRMCLAPAINPFENVDEHP